MGRPRETETKLYNLKTKYKEAQIIDIFKNNLNNIKTKARHKINKVIKMKTNIENQLSLSQQTHYQRVLQYERNLCHLSKNNKNNNSQIIITIIRITIIRKNK